MHTGTLLTPRHLGWVFCLCLAVSALVHARVLVWWLPPEPQQQAAASRLQIHMMSLAAPSAPAAVPPSSQQPSVKADTSTDVLTADAVADNHNTTPPITAPVKLESAAKSQQSVAVPQHKTQVPEPTLAAAPIEAPDIAKPKAEQTAKSNNTVERTNPKTAVDTAQKQAQVSPEPAANTTTQHDQGQQDTTVVPVLRNVNLVRQTPPVYPRRAQRMGQQGTVLIHALVGENGNPQDLKIAASSGYASLDQSAMRAVKSWRFDIASAHHPATKTWVEVPVQFLLR